jgi:hypothetical protein
VGSRARQLVEGLELPEHHVIGDREAVQGLVVAALLGRGVEVDDGAIHDRLVLVDRERYWLGLAVEHFDDRVLAEDPNVGVVVNESIPRFPSWSRIRPRSSVMYILSCPMPSTRCSTYTRRRGLVLAFSVTFSRGIRCSQGRAGRRGSPGTSAA